MPLAHCVEPSWIPAIVTVATATLVSYGLGHTVRKFKVLDAPDGERKTQSAPVVRLGGVAIFGTILVALAITFLSATTHSLFWGTCYNPIDFGAFDFRNSWLLFPAFAVLAFTIGLADDLLSLSSVFKLSLMLGACCVLIAATPPDFAITSPFGVIDNHIVIAAGAALWLLVFTNSANFMDGANGLTLGSLAIMFSGLFFLKQEPPSNLPNYWLAVALYPQHFLGFFTLLGAIIGFLIHNLRGKLYAGDAGSLGLGALFASLGLVSGLQVWTVATLALPFLIDVLMTLIWRAKHGRPWLKPHLDHAYQKLRLSGWSHIETASLYWGLSTVCAVAAVISAKAGGDAPFFVFWGLCLSGIVIWSIHRRGHPAEQ